MSIHAKRAAVVVVLVAAFTTVRIARPLLTALGRSSGGLGAVSFGPAEVLIVFIAPALVIGGLAYWLSWRSARRPAARR
jgi:hypothetical protein